MKYVIVHHVNITDRKGKKIEHDSYFENRGFGMDSFVLDPDKAMKFDFKTEAQRAKRKFFGKCPKHKVVKIEKPIIELEEPPLSL